MLCSGQHNRSCLLDTQPRVLSCSQTIRCRVHESMAYIFRVGPMVHKTAKRKKDKVVMPNQEGLNQLMGK